LAYSSARDCIVGQSPINTKLYDDILQRIFVFCLPVSDTSAPNESVLFICPTDQGPPFTFLFVCTRWRTLALDTSPLWRNVQPPSLGTDAQAFTSQAMSNQLKSLGQWLTFSKNLPLSIKCASPNHEFITSNPHINTIYQYASFLLLDSLPNRHAKDILYHLMKEEERWIRFDVVFDHHLLNNFLSAPQFIKPLTYEVMAGKLTCLKISFEGMLSHMDISNMKQLYSWIKKLPSLRTLVIKDARLLGATHLFTDVIDSPFEKIPKIEFSRLWMSAENSTQLLSMCTYAQDVCLFGHNTHNDIQEYHDIMSLCPLEAFAKMTCLSLHGIQFPTALLSHATFPVLEYL